MVAKSHEPPSSKRALHVAKEWRVRFWHTMRATESVIPRGTIPIDSKHAA